MIYAFNAGEAFKIALSIEDNGYNFYQAVAAKPFSPEVKKVFEELGREELSHKKFFGDLMAALPPQTTQTTVWDPDNEMDLYLRMMADTHVFAQKPEVIAEKVKAVSTPREAVEIAMGFEKDTVVFFLEMYAAAASDSASQEEIHKLIFEEQKHLKRLLLLRRTLLG